MPNIRAKDGLGNTIFLRSDQAGTDADPHLSNEDVVEELKTLQVKVPSVGQKPKADSSPVVLASDSDPIALAAGNNNIGDVDIASIASAVVASIIGTPVELLNSATGGSGNNRTFTVPANKVWQMQSLRVTYVSNATAGNRGLRVTYETSGGTVLMSQRAGATQIASQTREYAFSAGGVYEVGFGGVNNGGDFIMIPLPPLLLRAGQIIRLRDPANVSAGDTFTINGLALEWNV